MLIHGLETPTAPARAVILGARGFVGGKIAEGLRASGAEVLAVTRAQVDLSEPNAGRALAEILGPDDTLVFAAARAPVKNTAMLAENAVLLAHVVAALQLQPVDYVLNIGSDAVFADSAEPLTESSVREPTALHGVMHLAREVALESDQSSPVGTLRPTLIFGSGDPHNGYGPNRFARLAKANEPIVLFGAGEERRDHIHVADVADLAVRMVYRRSAGALNAATGRVLSFHDIAKKVCEAFGSSSEIRTTERMGPMPHNGYRPFDTSAAKMAFPDFQPTTFEDALSDLVKID